MIPVDQLAPLAIKKLNAFQPGQCLDIRTYKRDRRVVIQKQENLYHVYQDGFEHQYFYNVPQDKLPKLLKTLQKKEFPRSNQLRFYTLSKEEGSEIFFS